MTTATKSVDVGVPINVAYNQWTQFEDFPSFMDDVESVTQIDDRHLHWTVNIAGIERSFDTEITEQHPEERIAWRATNRVQQAGVVTFHKLDDTTTRVTLQLDMDPQSFGEAVGEKTGLVGIAAERDMKNFKQLLEQRRTETGAWRGDIPREG